MIPTKRFFAAIACLLLYYVLRKVLLWWKKVSPLEHESYSVCLFNITFKKSQIDSKFSNLMKNEYSKYEFNKTGLIWKEEWWLAHMPHDCVDWANIKFWSLMFWWKIYFGQKSFGGVERRQWEGLNSKMLKQNEFITYCNCNL